ncbi:MAG TPA: protein kinase [Anaerolineales bacterium]|nr:protein kinase [Anaerolineales bacterium]
MFHSSMEDLTGKQFGSYQVVTALGEGGMAAVYKAYQPSMDRYVALKVLPRHFASDPQFTSRFQQEARILARLQHPHILQVFDFGESDGYTYIVMPFVESGTLTDLMQGQPLALAQIRKIISQIGDALDYAHQRGLIHRDVKPSNVLMDQRGNCLLTDFGLAKIIEGSIQLTTSGMILGTPAYMSPEQGLGQPIDWRSDIYSLGVILYQMATGRIPYQAETPLAIVHKHIYDPLPMPHTLNEALPEALERVILKALAKKPEDRFGNASEMVNALQAAIADAHLATSLPQADSAQIARSQEPVIRTEQPPARNDATSRSSRSLAFWVGAGWVIAILTGLIFMRISPYLGGLVAGAVGGLGIGLVWRRMEPSVSRRQVLTLVLIWALSFGVALVLRPLFFLMGGVGGWFTGSVLRTLKPAMTRKQILMIALGWLVSWLLGGLLFVLATTALTGPASGLLVIVAMLAAGLLGGWVTFKEYRQTVL